MAASGQLDKAEALSTGSRPSRIAFQAKVDSLVQVTRHDLDAARLQAQTYSSRRSGDFLLTALIGIVAMLALSLWIVSHFITNPLQAITTAIIKTSRGDYDMPLVESEGKDEVSSVWQALAILKERAQAAEKMAAAQREAEHKKEIEMRQLLLD